VDSKFGTCTSAQGCAVLCLMLMAAAGCTRQECGETVTRTTPGPTQGVRPVVADPELLDFLARHKEATLHFLNGDESSWMELASHSDEASLFPPFGGVERGWDQVGARYAYVVARQRARGQADTRLDIELISSGWSGDLAYVVSLERSRFHVEGLAELKSGFTRVTHILGREQGQWKLLHRHMDHLPETFTPPGR
jgi:ketosteroid isomerase-like protein